LQTKSRAPAGSHRPSRRLLVSVAVALAFVCLFFLLEVVPHAHANGQDDRACGLCQVAHMGAALAVSVALLNLVLLYFGEIFVPLSQRLADSFFVQSPSRAPPALLA
jgi:hypothetical protein